MNKVFLHFICSFLIKSSNLICHKTKETPCSTWIQIRFWYPIGKRQFLTTTEISFTEKRIFGTVPFINSLTPNFNSGSNMVHCWFNSYISSSILFSWKVFDLCAIDGDWSNQFDLEIMNYYKKNKIPSNIQQVNETFTKTMPRQTVILLCLPRRLKSHFLWNIFEWRVHEVDPKEKRKFK